MGEVYGGIAIVGMRCIVRREENPATHMDLASPEGGKGRADKINRLDRRADFRVLCKGIRGLGKDLGQDQSWCGGFGVRNGDRRWSTYYISCGAAVIVITVMDVEDCLYLI